MKHLLILLTACALCATGVFADTLLNIDFENPPYTLGTLDGQQLWTPYPGFPPPDGNVVNSSPTPSQGSQCALLVSTSQTFCAEMYDMSAAVNDSTFNTNTHYLRITADVWADSAYNGIDMRNNITDRVRLVLFGIWEGAATNAALSGAEGQGIVVPVVPKTWNQLSILLDCKNRKVLEFSANGTTLNPTDFSMGGTAPYPQMMRISTDNSDLSDRKQTAFDALWVTTEPIPEPGMLGALVLGLLFLKRRK